MATLHELNEHFHLGRAAVAVALVPLGLIVSPAQRTVALAVIGTTLALYFDTAHVPGLIIVAALVYAAAWGLTRIRNDRRRWQTAIALIAATTIAYIVERFFRLDGQYVPVGRAHLLLFGLDMFLLLRAITLFWEVGSGEIAPLDPVAFVGWIALPFTIIGPFVRATEYRAALARDERPRLDAAWLWRVAVACAMIAGAVAMELLSIPHDRRPRWMRAGMLLIMPWQFYLGAGGYCSLMSTTSVTWGFAIPESFVRPFTRPNLASFWANWNVTVTNVFRDYLFYARWGRAGRPNVYFNAFIVFVLVGAWHDPHPFYLLWGVYHGIGYMVFLWYRANKASLRRRLPILSPPVAAAASVAATYLFVVFSWSLPLYAIQAVQHLALRYHW